MLFLASIFTNYNNNLGQLTTKNEHSLKKDDNYNSYPSYSNLDNSDRISFAEKTARWLWTKFQQNKWNESGNDYIELGQSGASGIGTFYIDLFEKTSNQTYLDWAKSVASWLIQQHPSSYPAGKWPNKIDTANALNYSGWAYGSAGIGSFFVKLYSLTSNNTYLTQAQNIHNYLSSIRKITPSGKGYVWQEKDPLSLTNEVCWPIKNNTIIGNNSNSFFSNIKSYDGVTYNTDSKFNTTAHKTDVEYWITVFEKIPTEDLYNINLFLKNLTIALSINSSINSLSSDIMIYNYGNNSWEPISSDSIGTSESHIEKTFTKDLANYASPIIKIKVNSSSSSSHTISIDALNATIDYNNKYNSSSIATGAAGIGNFYLEFYSATGNNTYLQYATGAANYTLEQAKKVGDKTAWLEYGKYYTGILKGTSGIADFLLEIYNVTHISTYLNEVKNAAKWLVSCNISSLGYSNTLIIGETNESTTATYVGAYYLAGIGNFFLKLNKLLPNNWYLNNASLLANWLMTLGQTVERNVGYGYQYLYYKWKDILNQDDYSYSTGTAGVLIFLNNLNSANSTKKVLEFLSGGIEWIKNTVNLTNASANEYWATSNNLYSVPLGLAGIGLAMINVDIKRPLISIYNVKSSYEYDGDITLYFNASASIPNSAIDEFYISYSYGQDYIQGIWNLRYCTNVFGNVYSYTFQYVSQGTTIYFILIARDKNGTFSADTNDQKKFSINIVDTHAPETEIIPSWDEGVGSGEESSFKIKVIKENVRGAAFNYCIISIPELKINKDIQSVQFDDKGTYLEYEFKFSIPSSAEYGEVYHISVTTIDVAMNTLVTTELLPIIDNKPPVLQEYEDAYSQWIPQFTEVEVAAKFVDDGSGIDDKKGVFVVYSTDDCKTWSEPIYLEKQEDKYVGKLPGQTLLVDVYYVFGAEDKEGNKVYYDKFYAAYSNIEDINKKSILVYHVIINWTVILIVIALIAVVIIISYAIYSKKGGYLGKMRREARLAATGLAFKEKLTNFYYKIYDALNSFGEKLSKIGKGGTGKVSLWVEEHIGEKFRNFFKRIGRFLYGIPLGIIHAIGYFFKGIGRAITKSKGWQLFSVIIFGFLILITTVAQFIMEGSYPIRAIIFANLGFLLIIVGIVSFLIRFLYKLIYK